MGPIGPQLFDLGGKCRPAFVISDHHVGPLFTFLVRHLGTHTCARLFRFLVSLALQALQYVVFGRSYNPDFIEKVLPAGLKKHGGLNDEHCGFASRALSVDTCFQPLPNPRPDDVRQSIQIAGVAKNDAPEFSSVYFTVRADDFVSEGLDHFPEGGLPASVCFMSHDVGIDYQCPELT